MADKPILFSAPMVRALLAGTKTQTRRLLKKPKWADSGSDFELEADGPYIVAAATGCTAKVPLRIAAGDRLWVKENFAIAPTSAWALPKTVSADPDMAAYYRADFDRSGKPRWKPSIHMPRWASRIALLVTEVRVQRLQEISDADAIAEGIHRFPSTGGPLIGFGYDPKGTPGYRVRDTASEAYGQLIDHLHGDGTWSANPWVAAYTFTVERR